MRYVVEIFQGETRLGAGFFVMPQYVLTARHCLPQGAQDDDLFDVRWQGEGKIEGMLRLPRGDADLALIEISRLPEVPISLLTADKSRHGDPWASPYRPGDDEPLLSGQVSEPLVSFLGTERWSFEAIQLKCDLDLKDYSGYSGSPIERPGVADPALLGILLEQYLDRQDGKTATNVLFAATMRDALGRFERLAVRHLLKVLIDDGLQDDSLELRPAAKESALTSQAHLGTPPATEMFEGIKTISDWLQERVEAGYLDIDTARVLTQRLAMKAVDEDTSGSSI